MPRPVPPEGRWTARHRLVSFYASDELREWLEVEVRRTGKSKTQIIVGALDDKRRATTDQGPSLGAITERSRVGDAGTEPHP